jgi:hypothetical protein
MDDTDSDEDAINNIKLLFCVIKSKVFQEDEKLKQIAELHIKGVDINPIDEKSGLTLLQTAQKKGYLTIVKYLKDKISESDALSNNVGEISNSPNTLNDNKSAASSSIRNPNENKASNHNKDTTNEASTNPIRKSVIVPGDGSCLFWAVTLAFLFPVRHDSAEFERRFEKLFDEKKKCPSKKLFLLI